MNLNWPADAAQFLTVLRFWAGSSPTVGLK